MTSVRAYRKALGHERAVEELLRCRGSQFDPDVADALLRSVGRDLTYDEPALPA